MDPSSTSSVLELAEEADSQTRAGMETKTDSPKVAAHLDLSLFGSKRCSKPRSCSTSKILSASAIFLALMLVVGAIFMQLRHRDHLGRLDNHLRKHPEHEHLVAAAGVAAQTITTFQPTTASSPSTSTTPTPPSPWQLSDECLACLATAATDNVPGVCRSKGRGEWQCGIYRISQGYWEDAQRLIDPMDTLARDYDGCVVDDSCAGRIVQSYVKRYFYDCNGDGQIECRDHAILHMRGPSGCRRHEVLPPPVEKRLEVCLKYKEIT